MRPRRWPCRACTWWSGGARAGGATDALLIGVDAPLVKRYPLAVDRARYAGEWVAAVVADSRALAEDAREKVRDRVRAAAVPARWRGRLSGRTARPYIPRMAPTCCSTSASYGATSTQAFAAAPHKLAYRVQAGAAAPPCRSRPSAWWRAGTHGARCSTYGPPSRCPSSPTRSRAPCACRSTACACIRTWTWAAATASSAASSIPCSPATSRAGCRGP